MAPRQRLQMPPRTRREIRQPTQRTGQEVRDERSLGRRARPPEDREPRQTVQSDSILPRQRTEKTKRLRPGPNSSSSSRTAQRCIVRGRSDDYTRLYNRYNYHKSAREKMATTTVLHEPRLDTILMVEK